MKITRINHDPLSQSTSKSSLDPLNPKRPSRRKIKNLDSGVRRKKSGSRVDEGGQRRSKPETPLLKWKFHEEDGSGGGGRKVRDLVLVRKLGGVLWRMQLPDGPTNGGENQDFEV
ncbi:hypothetical protein LIER_08625 [Lithospermum erythrorhizon]|uniref:Uncharacterized protein n=1 Tax=Lithospermum erythrorhizon TaxID=34254 RepID=A0AAV3PCW6_LITER